MSATGLLTRTVLRSPIIRWILPARLRGGVKNDIVFVGDNYIHLKEILDDGTVKHVTTKADFGCNILAAKVLAPQVANKDRISLETSVIASPDILVLALSNHSIQFISVKAGANSGVQFEVTSQQLIAMANELESAGRLIAIDSYSRLLAVAAHEKIVQVFRLNYAYRESPSITCLPESSITLNSDGVIVKMEFLYPSESTPDDSILAVLSRKNTRFHINIYEWNPDIGVSTLKSNNLPLGREHSMPNLFIPLKFSGTFLIVDERIITLYNNAHVGNIQQLDCVMSRSSPEHSGQSRAFPCWVSWARSLNSNRSAYSLKDYLYLARDDGTIQHLTISQTRVIDDGEVGRVPCSIDNAFAITSLGKDDLMAILVCGDQCDGYIQYVNEPRQTPLVSPPGRLLNLRQTDILDNWTSCRGVVTIDSMIRDGTESTQGSAIVSPGNSNALYSNRRMFMINGQSPYGRISELRYGIGCVSRAADPEIYDQGIISMDAVQMKSTKVSLVVFSRPWQSTLAYCYSSSLSEEYWIGDSPVLAIASLGLGPEALAATVEGDARELEMLVLVTSSQIKLHYVEAGSQPIAGGFLEIAGITAAAIDPNNLVVYASIYSEGECRICAKRLVISEKECSFEDVHQYLPLNSEGMCATSFELLTAELGPIGTPGQGYRFAAFGSASGHITICRLDESGCLVKVNLHLEQVIAEDNSTGPCENITILHPTLSTNGTVSSTFTVLLCTYRYGNVRSYVMVYDETCNTVRTSRHHTFSAGLLPAKIEPDRDNPGAAFIWSGGNLFHANYNGTVIERPCMRTVHFVGQLEDAAALRHATLPCGFIDGFTHAPMGADGTGRRGLFITASRIFGTSGLGIGYLSDEPKPFLQNINMPGSPISLAYSKEFDCLVVASACVMIDDSTKRRYSVCKIFTFKPDSQVSEGFVIGGNTANEVQPLHELKIGESVNDMLEWKITLDGQQFLFLVIAISTRNPSGRVSGCIKWVKVKSDEKGNLSFHKLEESLEKNPVQKLCSFGSNSLLYACGNELKRRTFSSTEMRFQKDVLKKLESRIVHITAKPPNVFVTTSEHSLHAFRIGDAHEAICTLYEQKSRLGLTHLAIPGLKLILVSGKNQDLAALVHADDQNMSVVDKFVSAHMEARLPNSIKHLVNANLRPPWKAIKPAGILRQNILGMSTTGALYELSLLSDACWQLLNFIQDLCVNNAQICPYRKPRVKPRRFHQPGAVESSTGKHHVNGDIIARLVEHSNSVEILNHMLDGHELQHEDAMELDGPQITEKRVKLYSLVNEVVRSEGERDAGDIPPNLRYPTNSSDNELAQLTLAYLKDIVDIPF